MNFLQNQEAAIGTTAWAAAAANWFKVTMFGSAGSIVGWLNSSNAGMWAGVLVALIGCIFNVYYKSQDNKRKRELHRVKLRRLETADISTISLDDREEDE